MIAGNKLSAALGIAVTAVAALAFVGAPPAHAEPKAILVTDGSSEDVVNAVTVGQCLQVDRQAQLVAWCPSGSTSGTDMVAEVPLGPLAAVTCMPDQGEIVSSFTLRKICTVPWPYGAPAP